MTGFCKEEVNPLGPVQLYAAPAKDLADKESVLPEQTGEFDIMAGAMGKLLTDTVAVAAGLVHPFKVADTKY